MKGIAARGAEFVSSIAYCDSSSAPQVFTGRLRGSIALRPSGQGGFGFDPIFIPEGAKRTLASMTLAEKCAISHRAAALRALAEWLTVNNRR